MTSRHNAWDSQWYPLAPGVRWRLRRPNAATKMEVTRRVAEIMRGIHTPDELVALSKAVETDGQLAQQIHGRSSVIAACLYAKALLEDWEGMVDSQTVVV